MSARDEHAGKRAKCPYCGTVITIEEAAILEETVPPTSRFKAVTLDIGHVSCRSGYISCSIKVTDDGDGHVLLYACESDTRRKGEMLALTLEEFSSVNGLVQKVSQNIAQLRAAKQIRGMIER
jgi:hypothetical protein